MAALRRQRIVRVFPKPVKEALVSLPPLGAGAYSGIGVAASRPRPGRKVRTLQTDTMSGPSAFRGEPGAPACVDGTDLARRCDAWQSALPHAEIVYPARVLISAATAKWMRNQIRDRNARVGVPDEHELALAIAAGIHPAQVVCHGENADTRVFWHAVSLGVGLFIVNAERQLLTISACSPQPQSVLVDVAATHLDGLIAAVIATERLELIGLHCHLHDVGQVIGDIGRVIGQMVQSFPDHAMALSRLSLAVSEPVNGSPQAVRAHVEAIGGALENKCWRLGVPQPVLTLSPH
jgi:diaminopimelate decarboxylase